MLKIHSGCDEHDKYKKLGALAAAGGLVPWNPPNCTLTSAFVSNVRKFFANTKPSQLTEWPFLQTNMLKDVAKQVGTTPPRLTNCWSAFKLLSRLARKRTVQHRIRFRLAFYSELPLGPLLRCCWRHALSSRWLLGLTASEFGRIRKASAP